MPAIWSSSERPISVRTVWVDGVRHAILTSDDPALLLSRTRRRLQTSSGNQKTYPLNYRCSGDSFDDSSAESLDSCFVKLHVVLEKRERDNEISSRIVRRQSAPPQCSRGTDGNPRNLLELRLNGVLNFTGGYSGETPDGQSNRSTRRNSARDSRLDSSRKNSIPTSDGITRRATDNCTSNCTDDTVHAEFEESTTPEIHSNLLSERVLQWMDLSGRVVDYGSDEDKDLRVKESDRGSFSSKPKGSSSLRREYSAMSAKEQVALQNYKMPTERKQQDSEAREVRVPRRRTSKDRESFDKIMMSNCKKAQLVSCATTDEDAEQERNNEQLRSEKKAQCNKTPWPSHGRPQLHIFMPDLNSSDDDVSSEESLTKE